MSNGLRVVALGGGTGLRATLTALRHITSDVTAVVTVADDGGSSGRIRQELHGLPPGDLRQALAALAAVEDNGGLWAEVLQYRFAGTGNLRGHAVGNLLLAGLCKVLGDPVGALDAIGRLIGISGRVLPLSTEPLEIVAEVAGLPGSPASQLVRGQSAITKTVGVVQRIVLQAEHGGAAIPKACWEAVDAVRHADAVFLGPGSWFTSVLPHVLVPELYETLVHTRATKAVIMNLVPELGETTGFSPERYLDVLYEHAPRFQVDTVIADCSVASDRLAIAAASLGARVSVASVSDPMLSGRHDPGALAAGIRRALGLTE